MSCNVEQRPQLSYVGGGGSNEYKTLEVHIPEDWKVINAELEPKQFIVEYDRGHGAEKQNVHLPFPIKNLNENMKYRGANRLDGLVLLHFSADEDPQSEFNPPIGRSKVTSGIREREEFAIFRTSNWLVIHYTIKNTVLGDLTFQDLTKRYEKKPDNDKKTVSFKTIDGKMYYNLRLNDKEKRSFLIDGYYGQHETYNRSSAGESRTNNEISWTWRYKIIPNKASYKVIQHKVMDR